MAVSQREQHAQAWAEHRSLRFKATQQAITLVQTGKLSLPFGACKIVTAAFHLVAEANAAASGARSRREWLDLLIANVECGCEQLEPESCGRPNCMACGLKANPGSEWPASPALGREAMSAVQAKIAQKFGLPAKVVFGHETAEDRLNDYLARLSQSKPAEVA